VTARARPRRNGQGGDTRWKPGASKPLKIDLDGLMQRVDRMPVIAANITQIDARDDRCST